jgi:hypothetical protein
MKRRIPGLSQAALPITDVPDGLYLVRVERIQYRWDKQKPFYAVRLAVVEPRVHTKWKESHPTPDRAFFFRFASHSER